MGKIVIGDISIDCKYPEKIRDFYANFMGGEIREIYGCPSIILDNGLVVLFMACDFEYIPPVWPEKSGTQQKQMHFDITVDDVPSAVEKAISLGATKSAVQYGGDGCITLFDTEGHPFCICKRPQSDSEFVQYYEKMGYGSIPDVSINIDCKKSETLREFYAELTDWDQGFHWSALIPENKMVIYFMGCDGDFDYVPPVWPEEPNKQQKQMHFNFQTDDLYSAVVDAIHLGATKPTEQYGGEHFITLLDPEGHPFCLCKK